MKYQIKNAGYPMEVHKFGCKDVKAHDNAWVVEAENAQAAANQEAAELNDQFDEAYPVHELMKLMPCAK